MIITASNLKLLTTGFKGNFTSGLALAASAWKMIATEVPSSTAENLYPWLKNLPGMRKWVGARVIKNIEEQGYRLKNEAWEDTVAVLRTSIEDDQFGVYAPMMTLLGEAAGRQPDELVFATLLGGFTSNCFDGQFFFDTDHPVTQADGTEVSVSNMQAGAGAPWFLLDTSGVMKPLIFQNRQPVRFVALDNPESENVFMKNEYIYGADSRNAAGYGFWQKAFGSKAPLTAANFEAAYDAMTNFKGDGGAKLGIKPTHLFCGASNRAAAEAILKKLNLAGGESNLNYQRVALEVVAWLD
jgi:phage major head subunit gpT-like protein